MALIAPFLDLEFQQLAGLRVREVDLYCRLALIVSEAIVATPSPFLESTLSSRSILLDRDIQDAGRLLISLRESSLEGFAEKKLNEYDSLNAYHQYYTPAGMETLFTTLIAPKRQRVTKIGETMRKQWVKDLENPGTAFGLHHILADANESLVTFFREVPTLTAGRAFVWEEVTRVLDSEIPEWRLLKIERLLHGYIFTSYIRAACDSSDEVASYNDFVTFPAEATMPVDRLVPLRPLLSLVSGAGLLESLKRCSPEQLLTMISSPEVYAFRERYRELLRISGADLSAALANDLIRERNYIEARTWVRQRRQASWSVFGLVGSWIAQRCQGKKCGIPITSFVDRAAEILTPERFVDAEATVVNHHHYNVVNAGAVGPGSSASHFHQSGIVLRK